MPKVFIDKILLYYQTSSLLTMYGNSTYESLMSRPISLDKLLLYTRRLATLKQNTKSKITEKKNDKYDNNKLHFLIGAARY